MPHVTFIHGISNKPPAPDLLRIWRQTLAGAASPLPLGDLGVTSSLVLGPICSTTRRIATLRRTKGCSRTPRRQSTAPATRRLRSRRRRRRPSSSRACAQRWPGSRKSKWRRRCGAALAAPPGGTLERVPLPWFLKQRVMNAFLRDVHHYLFDVDAGPPGRPAVHIQRVIRERFLDAVCAPAVTRPHVVVSHSMGTVIAYDCLKRLDGCAAVDGLITIGSPLGLDEIQDKLTPGWTRADGFPSEKVTGGWTNLFDRLDPVCGLDPQLASDYGRPAGAPVEDIPVQNEGAWRHSATVHAPTRVRGRAHGCSASDPMSAATDLDGLRRRAQDALKQLAGVTGEDLAAAKGLVEELRNAREYERMGQLAEAVSRHDPDDPRNRRLYAQY